MVRDPLIRRIWLGIAITALFVALALVRLDLGETWSAAAGANYAYLVPAIAVYFVSLYVRSYRWRYLLQPFAAVHSWRLYPVILVGYMANNILPVRLGELARSYYLSVREPVRGSTALATILVERVFDGLTLLVFLAVAALFLPIEALALRIGETRGLAPWGVAALLAAPFVGVLAGIVLVALRPEPSRALVQRLTQRLPGGAGARVQGVADRFIAGFEGLHRPSRLGAVFARSVPIWLAEAVMYYIVALGFDLQDQLGGPLAMASAILVVTAASNLATALPSSPGSLGPFEALAVLALVFLGVDGETALAYAIVLHLALLLPVIAAGLAHLAARGLTLGELMRRREAAVAPDAQAAVAPDGPSAVAPDGREERA
ncbi:MAG: flippase-like domain-containing protein [Chloroflexi bacterium]|nr:flippase-like domain-containing protein [Chloroflexota bacterium]